MSPPEIQCCSAGNEDERCVEKGEETESKVKPGNIEECGVINVSVIEAVDTEVFCDMGLDNNIVHEFTRNFIQNIDILGVREMDLVTTGVVGMEKVRLVEILDHPRLIDTVEFNACFCVKDDVSLINLKQCSWK